MLARPSALLASFAFALPVLVAAATDVRVPAYTQLTMTMNGRVNSDSARQGATFRFTVSEDVVVDGHVAIPKGSQGEGEVIHADDSGGRDHPGELVLAARFVDVNGTQVKLRTFVVGSTELANDGLAVPVFDKDTGGGRGDSANLGKGGVVTARTAEDVSLPAQDGDEPPRATEPAPPPSVDFRKATGTVVFFREWFNGEAASKRYKIREGKDIVGELGNGGTLTMEVPVGVHQWSSRSASYVDIRLQVDGGETYYVACSTPRSSLSMGCAPSNRALFEYMKSQRGRSR